LNDFGDHVYKHLPAYLDCVTAASQLITSPSRRVRRVDCVTSWPGDQLT